MTVTVQSADSHGPSDPRQDPVTPGRSGTGITDSVAADQPLALAADQPLALASVDRSPGRRSSLGALSNLAAVRPSTTERLFSERRAKSAMVFQPFPSK